MLFLPETSLKLKAKHAAPPPTPKTLTPTSPKSVAINVAKGSYLYCIRPLGTIFYLGSPAIGLTALYSSVCFASLYAISVSTPFLFSKPPYQLDSVDISFLYLPACVGYCIGSVAGGYLSDREIRKAKAQFGDSYAPEVRLLSARWGVPLLPAGLLIFGWGLHRHTHLALPMVGGFIFGVGLMLTNGTVSRDLPIGPPRANGWLNDRAVNRSWPISRTPCRAKQPRWSRLTTPSEMLVIITHILA